jgi:hypothetical protein
MCLLDRPLKDILFDTLPGLVAGTEYHLKRGMTEIEAEMFGKWVHQTAISAALIDGLAKGEFEVYWNQSADDWVWNIAKK